MAVRHAPPARVEHAPEPRHVPVRITRQGARLTLGLYGRLDSLYLDAKVWPELIRRVRENPPVEVVVSTESVEYIDSAAYGRLRDAVAAMRNYVPSVVLRGGKALARLLELRREELPERLEEEGEDLLRLAGEVEPAPQPERAVDGESCAPRSLRVAPDLEQQDDAFVIDLDFERMCLPNEGEDAQKDEFSRIEFTRGTRPELVAMLPDDALARIVEAERAQASRETPASPPRPPAVQPIALDYAALRAMLAPVGPAAPAPAACEVPVAAVAPSRQDFAARAPFVPAAPSASSGGTGIRDDLKDRVIESLLELDALRRLKAALFAQCGEAEARGDVKDRMIESLLDTRRRETPVPSEQRGGGRDTTLPHEVATHRPPPAVGHAAWDGGALEALRASETAWEKTRPQVAALVEAFRRELRLAPDLLGAALSTLARTAEASALSAYAAVLPPCGEEAPLCAALGMSAAMLASQGVRGAELEDALFVALLASLYDIDSAEPERQAEFVAQCETALRGLRPTAGPMGEHVRRALAFTRPVRAFVRLVADEGCELPEAIGALVTRAGGEGVRAFLALFGTCPRGSWVRLTDGTLAQVAAPLDDGLLVVRLLAERDTGLAPVPPTPLRVGQGRLYDVVSPVRSPAWGHADKESSGQANGNHSD